MSLSLSSLVSATEAAVRLSEAAVTAAEQANTAAGKALTAAKLARSEAFTAVKIALDLQEQERIKRDVECDDGQAGDTIIRLRNQLIHLADHDTEETEREKEEERVEVEDKRNEELIDEETGDDYTESGNSESGEQSVGSSDAEDDQEEEIERGNPVRKDDDSICENCKKTECMDGKFLVKVLKQTKGLKVVGWNGPSHFVGRVGTVVGRINGNVMLSWESDKKEKVEIYSLQSQGQFAFKYFCRGVKAKVKAEPPPPAVEKVEERKESGAVEDKRPSDRKLFVGGLEKSVSDDYLKGYFEQFGKLTDWVVMKSPGSMASLGYGFITFEEVHMVKSCVDSQPHYLNGKAVELKKATPPQPKPQYSGDSQNSSERKLFVGGLEASVTDDSLKEYFEKFGKLTDWVVMKNPVTRVTLGYGFITFEEPHMMESCLESQPHVLNGKSVGIGKVTPREGYQKEASVWVGSLCYSVTREDLRKYFEQFGQLTSWDLMIGKYGKGFGFVTFKSPAATEICLQAKPHYLYGKVIDVRRFSNRKQIEQQNTIPKEPEPRARPRAPASEVLPRGMFVVERLPVKGGRVRHHETGGEKHRIMFCASENITIRGVGLLVKTTIKKVTMTICHCLDTGIQNQGVIFTQNFETVSPSQESSAVVLKMKRGLQLSCDRIYLLVLNLHGGSSYVGTGGEEFVGVRCGEAGAGEGVREVLFKFEDFQHATDKHHQATDVEQGLVDRIYFEL